MACSSITISTHLQGVNLNKLVIRSPSVRSASLAPFPRPKGTRKTVTRCPGMHYVKLLSRKHARIVTKRVPSGELSWESGFTPPDELAENAESHYSRRFCISPSVLRGFEQIESCSQTLCFSRPRPSADVLAPSNATSGSKVSDSLVGGRQKVNTPVPRGVSEGTLQLRSCVNPDATGLRRESSTSFDRTDLLHPHCRSGPLILHDL